MFAELKSVTPSALIVPEIDAVKSGIVKSALETFPPVTVRLSMTRDVPEVSTRYTL